MTRAPFPWLSASAIVLVKLAITEVKVSGLMDMSVADAVCWDVEGTGTSGKLLCGAASAICRM